MVNILGVEVDDISAEDALRKVEKNISSGRQTFVVTPNPEIILIANGSPEFLKILNSADLKIPDGFGLKIGATILGQKPPSKIPGVDFMGLLCAFAMEKKYKIFLLGASEGVAKKAAKNLKKYFSGLEIAGVESGGDIKGWNNNAILDKIKESGADILFVALGQVKQEQWISENLNKMPNIKAAAGIGGALDFYAGTIRRAPKVLRMLGLEWLWRLILEPWRYKRIWNAVVVFPFVCLKERIKKNQQKAR